jgi:hypothetical protein
MLDPRNFADFAGAMNPIAQGKIDVALSQFARVYRNNAFVAETLFPRLEVNNQTDKYWTFGRENQQIFGEKILRAPGAAAERIVQTLSTAPYACVDHSLARLIPDEERGNFQAGDVEQWATGAVQDKILLDLEDRVATLAIDTASYAAGNSVTLAGAQQWSDYAGSDPLVDVEAGKAKIREAGLVANTMIIGDQVFQKIVNHPDLTDRFKYTTPRILTTADLAAIFGIQNVIVASAVKLSAALAATFVWGKNVVLAYTQAASMQDPSFGKLFVWTGAPGTVGGFSTEIGRVDPPSRKSDELAVHSYYDIRVTSNISAYLIKNTVA